MSSIVITTIQEPTPSILRMIQKGTQNGMKIIAIGDRRTPSAQWPEETEFVSLAAQKNLNYTLVDKLPENHYARKNIGYLLAMSQKSQFIFDTDDDNAPLDLWQIRYMQTNARTCHDVGWINAYRWFSDEHIWPRGLPLHKAAHTNVVKNLGVLTRIDAPIQQGLANGSPDVDAVWRLLMDKDITFNSADSVQLAPGAWCPFNSQSTWWYPPAYPLMYLPSFVSFRMTDIWRSFVAQRCLWALGYGVVFHGAEMFQDRNPHNLMGDFEQEISGYIQNDRISFILERVNLLPGEAEVGNNLHRCYEALIQAEIIPIYELKLVEAWLNDIRPL